MIPPGIVAATRTSAACTALWLMLSGCGQEPTADARSPGAAAAPRRTAPIDSALVAAVVDSVMASAMPREHIPGAAFVLVQRGRVVIAKAYGQANAAARRAWTTDATIFPIASISKLFTATAAMQLVDEGRVGLDTDVNRYLRSARVPGTYPQPVTLGHLLSHTAGLDELPGRRVRNASELMPLGRFLATRLVRVHPPGAMTSYSSYGVALAGLMVEDVSGLSYEDFLRQRIWQPLGMTRTTITLAPTDSAALAAAYELDDGKLVPVPYEMYQTPPAGSILSTASDMARFMVAHLQHGRGGDARLLSDSAAGLMHRRRATMHPRLPGWTLGFQENDLNGRRLLEPGGDIGGFSSLLTLMPDEDVGFFVVNHLEGSNLRFGLRQALLDRFFPDARPVEPPAPSRAGAERLRRLAGAYRANIFCHSCPDGGNTQDFAVEANADGSITLWDQRWVEVAPLYFVGADGRGRIGFAEDSAGRIVAVTAGSWKVLERVPAR
jgi:CubicO group peptidase (beta-lactamase class C family)